MSQCGTSRLSDGTTQQYDAVVTVDPHDVPKSIWDHGKELDGYRVIGRSLEPIAVPDATTTTPVDAFFVCNAGDAGDIDSDGWSLRIRGEVKNELDLDIAALTALTQHELPAWLECAGNGRRLFAESAGYEMLDENMQTPWLLNGVGLATWSGPRVRDILDLAGVESVANWVSPCGLDADNAENEPPRMCLPLEKAIHEDTIIALTMNGAPLVRSHGAPARLLVPGWVGAYSMKWLGELTVTSEWVSSWRADEYYVHRDSEGRSTGPLTAHPVKSNLTLDFPAAVEAGARRLEGFARSGDAPIREVHWRVDQGEWRLAELGETAGRWSWTPFSFEVELASGEHHIETRATDDLGNTQPAVQPHHPNGVLWQAITPHPITVR